MLPRHAKERQETVDSGSEAGQLGALGTHPATTKRGGAQVGAAEQPDGRTGRSVANRLGWLRPPVGRDGNPARDPARRIDESKGRIESIRDRPSPPGRCYRGGRHNRRPEETSIDVSGCWSARGSLEGGETDAVQTDHRRSPTDGRCPMPSRSKDA